MNRLLRSFIVRLRLSDQCDLAINAPCTVNGTTSPDAYAASVNRKLSKKLLTVEVYWRGRCHIAIFEKPT